jgi:hypothetical protein
MEGGTSQIPTSAWTRHQEKHFPAQLSISGVDGQFMHTKTRDQTKKKFPAQLSNIGLARWIYE